VSRYQNGKTNLILLKQESEWQWHQLGHMQVCTLLQTDNHASTTPLCRPTNSAKALKASYAVNTKHHINVSVLVVADNLTVTCCRNN